MFLNQLSQPVYKTPFLELAALIMIVENESSLVENKAKASKKNVLTALAVGRENILRLTTDLIQRTMSWLSKIKENILECAANLFMESKKPPCKISHSRNERLLSSGRLA